MKICIEKSTRHAKVEMRWETKSFKRKGKEIKREQRNATEGEREEERVRLERVREFNFLREESLSPKKRALTLSQFLSSLLWQFLSLLHFHILFPYFPIYHHLPELLLWPLCNPTFSPGEFHSFFLHLPLFITYGFTVWENQNIGVFIEKIIFFQNFAAFHYFFGIMQLLGVLFLFFFPLLKRWIPPPFVNLRNGQHSWISWGSQNLFSLL